MDAFFASVEQLDFPELRGKPVVVGAAADKRGVVAAASYEARKYGIHSAMPSRTAHKLCPHAVFQPGRHSRYADLSRQIMGILAGFTPYVQPISIDEAFLDVSGVMHMWPDVTTLAEAIRECIRQDVGLTASVGVASNKFLAKLASDMDKPDGLTVLPEDPEEIVLLLSRLPARAIWGVGKTTAAKLETYGIHSVGDIQSRDPAELGKIVGERHARHLIELAHGRDTREVSEGEPEKSISNETTFGSDVSDRESLHKRLLELTEKVGRRLRRSGHLASTGQIKLRDDTFTTITRQQSFPAPTDTDRDLIHCALDLFDREPIPRPIRLIGFGVSNLSSPGEHLIQPMLFEDDSGARRASDQKLDAALDQVRDKFGKDAVRRGFTRE